MIINYGKVKDTWKTEKKKYLIKKKLVHSMSNKKILKTIWTNNKTGEIIICTWITVM